jgi:methyl-accepting chemotaxis protein
VRLINSSIRRLLFAAFAAVAALFLIALAIGYQGVGSVNSQLTGAGTEQTVLQAATGHARDMLVSEAMTLLTPSNAADHKGDVQTFEQTVTELGRIAATPAARAAVAKLKTEADKWIAADDRVIADAVAGRIAAGKALQESQTDPMGDDLTAAVQNVSKQIAHDQSAAASSTASTSQMLMLVLALVALALAGLISVLISRDLSGRVGRLLRAISRLDGEDLEALQGGLDALASGDLSVAVEAHSEPVATTRADEIAALTNTFNAMVIKARGAVDAYNTARGNVVEMLGEINDTSTQLTMSSRTMAGISDETGRAITSIADAIHSVSLGAEEQVKAVVEAKRLTDEVSTASSSSAAAAQETAVAAEQARGLAQDGAAAVARATEAMQAVRSTSEQVTEAVRALDAKSGQIGQIVDTITGIAEQTNLLALNAAIEAARAGEQGRGFAVVAEEVRKLAEESQAAAATIGELITEIQRDTRAAVDVGETGAQQTVTGAETVEQARDAFDRISEAISDMSDRVAQIASSVEQIAGAGARMQESIGAVAKVAEESSATTEEVSASTEQTTASTQEVATSADSLAQSAEQLARLVGQFTIG